MTLQDSAVLYQTTLHKWTDIGTAGEVFILQGIQATTVKQFSMANPLLYLAAANNKQNIWQYLKLLDKLSMLLAVLFIIVIWNQGSFS